jgi:hypothetical protein
MHAFEHVEHRTYVDLKVIFLRHNLCFVYN